MSTCIVILLLWYIYKHIYTFIKEEQCFPTSRFKISFFKSVESSCASLITLASIVWIIYDNTNDTLMLLGSDTSSVLK